MDFFVVRSKFCCEFLSSIWQHLPPIDPIFICVDPIWIWIHNTGRNYSLLCYYFYALLRVHMLNHLRTEWRKNMIKKGKTELNVEVDLWIISWQVGKNLIQGMGVKCWKRSLFDTFLPGILLLFIVLAVIWVIVCFCLDELLLFLLRLLFGQQPKTLVVGHAHLNLLIKEKEHFTIFNTSSFLPGFLLIWKFIGDTNLNQELRIHVISYRSGSGS